MSKNTKEYNDLFKKKAKMFLSVSDFRKAHPEYISEIASVGRFHPYCSHMKTQGKLVLEDIEWLMLSSDGPKDFFNKHSVAASKAASEGWLFPIMSKLNWINATK